MHSGSIIENSSRHFKSNRNSRKKPDQSGFSLIEVVVVMGIMTVLTLGFASYMSFVNTELRAAHQKMEFMELRTTLGRTLSDLSTCSCQLNLHASTFNGAAAMTSASVSKLNSSCDPAASVIIEDGQPVANSNTRLTVQAIAITDIRPLGVSNKYEGKFTVSLQNDGLVRGLRDIRIDVQFMTDPASPPGAKKIQSCVFVNGGMSGGSTLATLSGSCPVGQFLTGFSSGVVQCSAVLVGGKISDSDPAYTLTSPGDGCIGTSCRTADYGPCSGPSCTTNGLFCEGPNCAACAMGASCSGTTCCAGPSCDACSIYN
ncbi:MAG: prepilin-type N-terminal cleavage/methylation domain-containing protein [Bdellovibrionaceae bacterium]|nr:prepilin-type N-terminal cleavage/methylation domain-containing protein [Pseudobdellovibrionaceae bacterium]